MFVLDIKIIYMLGSIIYNSSVWLPIYPSSSSPSPLRARALSGGLRWDGMLVGSSPPPKPSAQAQGGPPIPAESSVPRPLGPEAPQPRAAGGRAWGWCRSLSGADPNPQAEGLRPQSRRSAISGADDLVAM